MEYAIRKWRMWDSNKCQWRIQWCVYRGQEVLLGPTDIRTCVQQVRIWTRMRQQQKQHDQPATALAEAAGEGDR